MRTAFRRPWTCSPTSISFRCRSRAGGNPVSFESLGPRLRGGDECLCARVNLTHDHPRRQPRSPHAPSARLAQPGVLRRGGDPQGDGAHLRHLPRLSALRQPVPVVPDAFRPRRREQNRRDRRRRPQGLLEGRRPVLPVRPLLHDQVPVRSPASVERRLSALDAARQGLQVPDAGRKLPGPDAHRYRPHGEARLHSGRCAGGELGEPNAGNARDAGQDLGRGEAGCVAHLRAAPRFAHAP